MIEKGGRADADAHCKRVEIKESGGKESRGGQGRMRQKHHEESERVESKIRKILVPEEYKLAAHRTRETNTHTHTHTYTRGHRTQFGSRAFGLGEISRAPEQAQGPR